LTESLRVAVPDDLFLVSTTTGRGRVWHEVLCRLTLRCELLPMDLGKWGRLHRMIRRNPQAWLLDGHEGPLPVRGPQIIQIHEAPWNEPETMATLSTEFIDRVVEPTRRATQVASSVICPSESSKRQIVMDSNIEPNKVFVAAHGVDHNVFRPGLDGGADVAVRHGADPRRPYILTVASVHPRKNLLSLTEAMGLLASEHFPHQLVIVGSPPHGRTDGEELTAALCQEGTGGTQRTVFVPFGISDSELAALMSGASAFCLPSLSEGFGLPAAEAMACGTPTVLSNRGALVEVGQGAAVLVEPHPMALADGLRSVLADPARATEVAKRCAKRAQSFSWDHCADVWLQAITSGVHSNPAL
jgi:glycosyltransferase involved in cell wall biosynthesis